VRAYEQLRYCQFTPEGDRWRLRQAVRSGYDPCDENQPRSGLEKGVLIAFGAVLILTITAFALRREGGDGKA